MIDRRSRSRSTSTRSRRSWSRPATRTFPIFVYSGTKVPASRPELLAIAAIVIAISLMLVVVAEVGRQWVERRQTGSAGADIVG